MSLEDFADAARALLQLHASFPTPALLEVDTISGPEETDEFGMHSPRYRACFATLLWLAEEGYLRYDSTVRNECLDAAVLTGRAFVYLTRTRAGAALDAELPESVARDHSSLAYALQRAVREGSSTATTTAMLELMQQMHA